MRFLTLGLAISAAVSASPSWPGHRKGPWWHKNYEKTVYFLDDDPSGSSVVSLRVGKDHLLSDPERTSTNGYGAIGTNLTGFPNPSDALMGQSAVFVSGDLLFTVNAGSNTLAMFRIDPRDPRHPKLVGEPADTLGDFPMSVAYSEALKTACVLNGGARSGVSCFQVDPASGLTVTGGLRSLAGHLNETTPPSGPPGSAAQVIFDPQSTGVFAMLKGNAGSTPPLPGAIVGFAVENGHVSWEPIVTQIDDLTMEFGSVFITDTKMMLSDPSFGISLLELGSDLMFSELVHTVVSTQKALCWAEKDLGLGMLYGNDAAENKVYTFNPDTGAWTGTIPVPGKGPAAPKGVFDSVIDEHTHLMYALVGANGVVTLDLEEKKQIQFLDLSSFGDRQNYQGMAIYPAF